MNKQRPDNVAFNNGTAHEARYNCSRNCSFVGIEVPGDSLVTSADDFELHFVLDDVREERYFLVRISCSKARVGA